MSKNQSRKLARTFSAVSLLVVAGAVFAAVSNASEGPTDPHAGMVQMVVGNGETLWSIASMASGNQNVQSVVDQIAAANNLTSDRKSTRLNSSHTDISRMPSSA